MEIKNDHPELLHDYRVKPVLIKGLGASYSELADEVWKTVAEMGREMIPLLKKEFDPKGKKESVRCVNVIEKIAGAEENGFYLEQLDFAEKDMRKALIYALRHDEANFDKLVELTKTEKGKAKTAALSAISAFDCERSAEFFEEYAKKKPVDVIKIMNGVSSKWTSELTARLIDELLVDDKGNKITLSQSADVKKVKLKAKLDFFILNSALWGKWGDEVEKFYREYDNREWSAQMSVRLGDTIILTKNESLIALAIELNNKSKLKGHYDYAETAARFVGKEDCSEWLKKRIRELKLKSVINPKEIFMSNITRVLRMISYKEDGYVITAQHLDDTTDQWINIEAPISHPMKELTDIFIKNSDDYFHTILGNWIDPDDREYCGKLGKYFVEEFMKKPEIYLLNLMRKTGVKNVKGLARAYFDSSAKFTQYGMKTFFKDLPGDDDYKLAEAREIADLARKGKLKAKLDVDEFSLWVESGMK